jgi:predicted ArsR family transcriptional regulator
VTVPPEYVPRLDQARALGDPTRHEIHRYLSTADGDVTVAELTTHLGLNHNAIRQHLAKLVAAGLATESREARDRPGRPRLVYRARGPAPDPRPEYERLAVLLAEVTASGQPAEVVGRRVGARLAAPVTRATSAPIAALEALMAGEGFEPKVRRWAGRTSLVLGRCPYEAAAVVDGATVCALHRGIAEGAAGVLGGIEIDDLVTRDPRAAGCRLELSEAAS